MLQHQETVFFFSSVFRGIYRVCVGGVSEGGDDDDDDDISRWRRPGRPSVKNKPQIADTNELIRTRTTGINLEEEDSVSAVY